MALVNRIQKLCEEHGTTLIGLERTLGFGRGTIRKWDSSSPSIDKIAVVAKFFNISIDYLLSTEEKFEMAMNTIEEAAKILNEVNSNPSINLDDSIYDITSRYKNEKFTDEEKKEIFSFIDFIISKRNR